MHSFLVAVAVAAHLSLPPEWLLPPHRPTQGGDPRPCSTNVVARYTLADGTTDEWSDEWRGTIDEAGAFAERIGRSGFWLPRDAAQREVRLVLPSQITRVTIHPTCDWWWESVP